MTGMSKQHYSDFFLDFLRTEISLKLRLSNNTSSVTVIREGKFMRISKRSIALSALVAAIPSQSFAIAISPGSNSVGALGNTANAIVRISDPGGSGTGTIIQITPYDGGEDLDVLTADHVVRDGGTLYSPSLITTAFGNSGSGGASFAAEAVATDFTFPEDGSSGADLAMLDVFVPGSQLNTLPAPLISVNLPTADPAANAAITQAGYGLQASVVTISGNLGYSYSSVFGDGAGYGTLAAGPNTLNGSGVTAITGAVSEAGPNYMYQGFQNGALINGTSPNYNGSTSYIFSGDSGGPSLSGNTIFGVHSSSVTGTLAGDPNSEFAYSNNASYTWSDVDVYSYLPWIDGELTTLSPVPEPATGTILLAGILGLGSRRFTRRRQSV
jgi:hypothetical protein